jgi:hypothetical protein
MKEETKNRMINRILLAMAIIAFTMGIIDMVSAIPAGQTIVYTTEIENLTWEVTGNSSNLEGLTIEHIGNEVIITTAINYLPDSFNLTFYDENHEEVIVIPEERRRRSGGGLRCASEYEKINGKCVLREVQNQTQQEKNETKVQEELSSSVESSFRQTDPVENNNKEVEDEKRQDLPLWYLLVPVGIIIFGFIFWIIKNQFFTKEEIDNYNKFNELDDKSQLDKSGGFTSPLPPDNSYSNPADTNIFGDKDESSNLR